MIDISQSFIPDYVRAFRDLHAPLGVVTVLGNHDRYTGQDAVIKGVRDAGQVFVRNGAHVIERGGAALALVGIDDPRTGAPTIRRTTTSRRRSVSRRHRRTRSGFSWRIAPAPSTAPPRARYRSRSPATSTAVSSTCPSSAGPRPPDHEVRDGALHARDQPALRESRIGVVGVPLRVFVPPEIALFELRRG